MYKYKAKISLTFQKPKPIESDYEANVIWRESYFNSRQTALNIKHRIMQLNSLNMDSYEILQKIVEEINEEIKDD